jgi:DNA mismatch repair protein MutS
VSVSFHSILWPGEPGPLAGERPAFFPDLNLDQAVEGIVAGREEYDLEPFFHTPLRDLEAIRYRQEVFRDLEDPALGGCVRRFAQGMRGMREHLAMVRKLHYPYPQASWFLDAVALYCQAVLELARDLSSRQPLSAGLRGLCGYLAEYLRSPAFTSLEEEVRGLQEALASLRYSVLIHGDRVTVRPYASESDYGAEIEATFAKFRQGAVKDYRVKFSDWPEMNHVEAQILEGVARLYPELFARLEAFYRRSDYLDPRVAAFDREVQFYLAYLEYLSGLRAAGLPFCYPSVGKSKAVAVRQGFDLALAKRLVAEGASVVCNDFFLQGSERIFVVSGPNQGGKTTFARTFGQLHYLASLGAPVPAGEARLFLYDRIFTHFEREEAAKDLRGKLQDDLVRLREILTQATPESLVILNEIFSSTALEDAVYLSRRVLEAVSALDALGVCVTFLEELSRLNEKTVSLVSTVSPEDPAVRTFKLERRPADGLAYALAVAEKYGLTYLRLKERLGA